jgi:hypothetical protein
MFEPEWVVAMVRAALRTRSPHSSSSRHPPLPPLLPLSGAQNSTVAKVPTWRNPTRRYAASAGPL